MANEKEIVMQPESNATATATENADVVEAEERVEGSGVKLPLKRRAYSAQGKTYYSYFVPLVVKGLAMELEVRPKDGDVNAYRFLNLIFADAKEQTGIDQYELNCQLKSMRGSDGKRMAYMTYSVEKEVDGIMFVATVKPYGDSNKQMLETLYQQKVAAM